MSRNIVLCFDGTNNKYADRDDTNVIKLFQMLDRDPARQICYYQPGIGTMAPAGVWGKTKTWFIEKLDLAIAWLLEEHVSDGYRFLMRYYEPGDSIYIFGFSRGAYSARALAAMLHKVGLLMRGNEELIPFAWDTFKSEHRKEVSEGFKATFSRSVGVHLIGVWDTVSSVGWMWNPKHLPFSADNPSVKYVRHAVSLDEQRAYFPQNMWTGKPGTPDAVKQVWFPGVHCDVGGGYKEPAQAGLSKIALEWMVREAAALDLKVVQSIRDTIIPSTDTADYAAPNPSGMQHQSLQGIWWIAEIIPKPYLDPADGFKRKWRLHLGRHRYVPQDPVPVIHKSVIDRMSDKKLNYAPPNLPTNYTVVT